MKALKRKFSFILFVYNLTIGCSTTSRENYPGNAFEQKKKKLGLKFNLGLALIGLRTTGSCRGLQNAESKLKEVGEVARVKEREPGTSATRQDIRTTHRQKA